MKPIVSRSPHFIKGNSIMGLNGVRSVEGYGGKRDGQDLLDLYAGNIGFHKINRYMRSPDHQAGINEILNEFVKDGRKPVNVSYQQAYNEQAKILIPIYNKFNSFEPEVVQSVLNQTNSDSFVNQMEKAGLIELADEVLKKKGIDQLDRYDNDTLHDWYRSTIEDLQKESLESAIHTNALNNIKSENWYSLRQEAEQVVSSIPHINKAIAQQPKISYNKDPKELANSWYEARYDEDIINPDATRFRQILEQHGINEEKTPNKAIKFARAVKNGEIFIDLPATKLVRGLHFKSPEQFALFKAQHQTGDTVEYPTFISTTTDNSIAQGYSGDRGWQHPVVMNFEPSQSNGYNAYDVNNPIESEYVFAPNSRFEVLETKTIPGAIRTGVNSDTGQPEEYRLPEGLELRVRETNQPTQVRARTQSILDNLKAKKAQQLLNTHLASVAV